MSNSVAASRKLAVSVVVWQIAVAWLAAAWFWHKGPDAALAALFGGLVVIVPTAWFALAVLVRGAVVMPHKLLGVVYRAEVAKLILMALGFMLGALWFGDRFAALIITSAVCMAVNWMMLAVGRKT